jgi:hypothetical protein
MSVLARLEDDYAAMQGLMFETGAPAKCRLFLQGRVSFSQSESHFLYPY